MKASSLAIIVLAVVGHAAAARAADPAPAAGESGDITNAAQWKDGLPFGVAKLARPPVESVRLFEPTENDWKFAHHQSIAVFGKRLFAIWSSSLRDEDSPGQRVMYAAGDDGKWESPRILFQPDIDPDGRLRILTAGGFHVHGGTLVAYAGDYAIDRKSTTCWPAPARTASYGPFATCTCRSARTTARRQPPRAG